PSPSNGLVPKPPGRVPSSTTVTFSPAIFSPSFPAKNDAPRYTESPFTPSNTWSSSERATSGSNTTGTCAVFTFRAPNRRNVRCAAILPTSSGDSRHFSARTTENQQYDRRYSPTNPCEFASTL